jgi:menaquinone-dependent protoporphyrinogen oxidase
MKVLVAYASKHGSTRGIAERIAERLRTDGLEAEALPVKSVRDVATYDAFVVGSALYMFRWMGEARAFVHRNRKVLAGKPIWLFSSGPFGPETTNKEGRNLLEVSGPKEIDELRAMLQPRDHRVFFGSWDAGAEPVGLSERLMMLLPAVRKAFPVGDYRDWPAIEAWADAIAGELDAKSAAR